MVLVSCGSVDMCARDSFAGEVWKRIGAATKRNGLWQR